MMEDGKVVCITSIVLLHLPTQKNTDAVLLDRSYRGLTTEVLNRRITLSTSSHKYRNIGCWWKLYKPSWKDKGHAKDRNFYILYSTISNPWAHCGKLVNCVWNHITEGRGVDYIRFEHRDTDSKACRNIQWVNSASPKAMKGKHNCKRYLCIDVCCGWAGEVLFELHGALAGCNVRSSVTCAVFQPKRSG